VDYSPFSVPVISSNDDVYTRALVTPVESSFVHFSHGVAV